MAQSEAEIAAEYRRLLVDSEQKSIESFDKAVLALSGGALGLSMAFLNGFVGPAREVQTFWLLFAWCCWAASLILTLSSFWLSARAMRRAVQQLDDYKIGQERPGGFWDWATGTLTLLGGLTFIVGVFAMKVFIWFNL